MRATSAAHASMRTSKLRSAIWVTAAGLTIISLLKFKLGSIGRLKLLLVPIIIPLPIYGHSPAPFLK